MTKLALLIGVSYLDTPGQLDGTVNDVMDMEPVLLRMGFAPENMIVLANKEVYFGQKDSVQLATRENVLAALGTLVRQCQTKQDINEIYIHFSGHGTYMRDQATNPDEDDGKDECLVPEDYETNGFIRDDKIIELLGQFPKHVTVIGFVDACHSGTSFDLPYRYVSGNKFVIENKTAQSIQCRCIMISGCKDNQTSADAFNLENAKEYRGAGTFAFRTSLRTHDYSISMFQLLKSMWRILAKRKFKQRPQITTNVKFNRGTQFIQQNKHAPFIK